jgi:hypothetical protein
MSFKSLRFPVSLVLLLLGLTLASLPAEARPLPGVRRLAVTEPGKVSGVFSTLQALFASLWPVGGALEKEGMSIDPDGGKPGANAVGGDEGVTIDPNGAK